jgi:hypothetical protein
MFDLQGSYFYLKASAIMRKAEDPTPEQFWESIHVTTISKLNL